MHGMNDGIETVDRFVEIYEHLAGNPNVSHDMAMAFVQMYVEMKTAQALENGLMTIGRRSHHGFTGPG